MYVYVMRHGQSRHNVGDPENHPFRPEVKDIEDRDPSLTAHGKMQADRAGRRLSSIDFDAVFCGPIHRQIDTAYTAMLHQKKKPRIEVIPDLTEWGCEDYYGVPDELYSVLFPEIEIVPCGDPSPTGCPRLLAPSCVEGNEKNLDIRGEYLAKYLRSRFSGSANILLVTSAIFGGVVGLPYLLGTCGEGNYKFEYHNTGISMIEIKDGGETVLHFANDNTHLLLPDEDMSEYSF